ncbi:MAG: hypothetical protein JXR50_06050 [Prolixibacteraceae bacterium]|nr:hypothetical protein [Prolixibacteraceae bacterium]MBN2649290.1 hypothetical protein [Prolixibacteraceae bacterium]
METKNKISKSFGPQGSTAGLLLFAAGIVATFYSNMGLFLALGGAFMAFTTTSTIIDTSLKRVKPVEKLFGILPFGKWIYVNAEMKLGIEKSRKGFRVLSASNKSSELIESDYRIILYDDNELPITPLKKFLSCAEAEKEIGILKEQLIPSR